MKKYNQIEQLNILFGNADHAAQEKTPINGENNDLTAFGRRNGTEHRSNTANALTWQIIRFIQRHGGQAERVAVMGVPREAGGRTIWTHTNMTVGTADISATIQGRSVKIEVKIGTDRQSEAQKRYQNDIEQAGGIYYIARTFEEFLKWYNLLWGTATIKG